MSEANRTGFGRKIRWLAIAFIALIVLVVAGWFAGAQVYRAAIDENRTALARDGVTLTCTDETLVGFPARFEWRCTSLSLTFANGGTLSGGAVNTVAPVWNPLFTIVEWAGPFQTLSADGFEAVVASELMRASIRLDTSLGLERLSAVLDPFAVTLQDAPQAIASGNQVELHIRQSTVPVDATNEDDTDTPQNAATDDLDVALVVFGLESPFLGGVDQVDLSISGLMEQLADVRARSVQGLMREWVARSGRITPLATRLRFDDLAINLDGNAAIGVDGLIDFDGTIATNDVSGLVALMGIDADDGASAIAAGATLFGRQTTIGEDRATELPLRVTQSAVRIGPVSLGLLPALQF